MQTLKPETNAVKALERYLPKHLMALVSEEVVKKGFEFREDIRSALIVNAAADITGYNKPMGDTILSMLDSIMPGMVRTLPNDERKALLAASVFVLQLVDRGLYKDPKSSAVATALLLVKEAEEDGEMWGCEPKQVHREVNNLITYCNLKGLYLTSMIQ